MTTGDFVSVHTEDGCVIGRFISDDGDTVTVELNQIGIGAVCFYGIPKEIVTLYATV